MLHTYIWHHRRQAKTQQKHVNLVSPTEIRRAPKCHTLEHASIRNTAKIPPNFEPADVKFRDLEGVVKEAVERRGDVCVSRRWFVYFSRGHKRIWYESSGIVPSNLVSRIKAGLMRCNICWANRSSFSIGVHLDDSMSKRQKNMGWLGYARWIQFSDFFRSTKSIPIVILGGRNLTWLWIREILYVSIIPFLYIYMCRSHTKHRLNQVIPTDWHLFWLWISDILLLWMLVSMYVMSLLIDERNSLVAVPCCSFSISGIPSLVRFCGGSDPSKGGHLVIHWWSPRYAARESIGVLSTNRNSFQSGYCDVTA